VRLAWAAWLVVAGCAAGPRDSSDAPESRFRAGDYPAASSHAEALVRWRRAEDLNAFIGERFEYDRQRALRLSETQRAHGARVPILAPAVFFAEPRGVCVDLARFAVETLNAIEPGAAARFIMIEFEPVTIGGNTLRLHWLASFRRDGGYYFFADSKRPGHIAGPYATVGAFIAEYQAYRERRIVAFRELESYERKVRQRASRQDRQDAGPAQQ
jgi:hypothetical protein